MALGLEERPAVPRFSGLRLPPPATDIPEPRQRIVKHSRVLIHLATGGQLGKLVARNPGDLLPAAKQHRCVVDELGAQLLLKHLHLPYKRIYRAPGRTHVPLINRYEQESVVSNVPPRSQRGIMRGPLGEKAIDFGQHTALLAFREGSLGRKNPNASIFWKLSKLNSWHRHLEYIL